MEDRPILEDALNTFYNYEYYTWTDTKNKIYNNLVLLDKVYIEGVSKDNTATLPTEAEVNAKLKELQDAWDAANG